MNQSDSRYLVDDAMLAEWHQRAQELEDDIVEGIPTEEAIASARQMLRDLRRSEWDDAR